MPDYSDFLAAERAKAATAAATNGPRHAALERLLQTLGDQMADLVGSDDWASYRKAIEAARAGEQAALTTLTTQILAPDSVGESLLKLKLEAQRIAGRIEGLELALQVPTAYQTWTQDSAATAS